MKRILDPNEPWVCPPSLRLVFAKRQARRDLREAKGALRRAELELRAAQATVDALTPKAWRRAAAQAKKT